LNHSSVTTLKWPTWQGPELKKVFPFRKKQAQDDRVGREKFGDTNHCKEQGVAGNTVHTESKQNIPWKGNCLYFHSCKFRFAFSVQTFSDQNAKSVKAKSHFKSFPT